MDQKLLRGVSLHNILYTNAVHNQEQQNITENKLHKLDI